ncbi:uncharacterized protein MELLADRAFT_84496 [Melampsora larici-populina 98AG31]|uniref:Uncharacterized protein n=1 Tax=Melampsora larici-populina (strain 98AG31 / pathotype 3-4-7) TaxID=747676 RepID=F4SC80_MELLP|nr:uncharacterized protein MELLADRAFT_84496 [Melampsora larici-populina 98AG31]EGF97735.1 hypothetical protein MELLADRAFT_84496 [Melampsora larici-populina 98AG31]
MRRAPPSSFNTNNLLLLYLSLTKPQLSLKALSSTFPRFVSFAPTDSDLFRPISLRIYLCLLAPIRLDPSVFKLGQCI